MAAARLETTTHGEQWAADFGRLVRAAALVVVVNMGVAVGLAHMGDLGKLNPQGGWALEVQAMYLFAALAIAFLGAGRLSVGGLDGRMN